MNRETLQEILKTLKEIEKIPDYIYPNLRAKSKVKFIRDTVEADLNKIDGQE